MYVLFRVCFVCERCQAESERPVGFENGTRAPVRNGALRQAAVQNHSGRRDPRASREPRSRRRCVCVSETRRSASDFLVDSR